MSFYVFRFGLFFVSVASATGNLPVLRCQKSKNVVSLGVALHYLFMDTFLSPRALVRGPDRAGPAAIKNWDLCLDFLLKNRFEKHCHLSSVSRESRDTQVAQSRVSPVIKILRPFMGIYRHPPSAEPRIRFARLR